MNLKRVRSTIFVCDNEGKELFSIGKDMNINSLCIQCGSEDTPSQALSSENDFHTVLLKFTEILELIVNAFLSQKSPSITLYVKSNLTVPAITNSQNGESTSAPGDMTLPKPLIPVESTVTFKDVGGNEKALKDLGWLCKGLKNPKICNREGARLPKGILLHGPSGTGKTLLARAVAGEIKVPFFKVAGSEFVEVFVGKGAGRIRTMFSEAQKNAPCIVFIDEIDAVGKSRGGNNDEREQTLNQLLVEIDGFDQSSGIILLAATNRLDTLDEALTRPGRFDRLIEVKIPNDVGRYQILEVQARLIEELAERKRFEVDWNEIVRKTTDFSGADLTEILRRVVEARAKQAVIEGNATNTLITVDEVLSVIKEYEHEKTSKRIGFKF